MNAPLLPILQRKDEIMRALSQHQVVVICGETGSGKTTQLPQLCLTIDEQRGVPRPSIAHTQPRRIAARSVAARIADERGEPLGRSVGYKVRFAEQTSKDTRIKLLTDGMLLAELAGDRMLRDYSTIVIDEAHERSLNVDFLLGYLRALLPKRPELKLVITSATIEPKRFSDYFGGAKACPVLEVSGRTFPIEVRYRDASGTSLDMSPEAIADAVEELDTATDDGDTLVFLPGEREIRLAHDAIARRGLGVELLPLYSRLSNQDQDRVFRRDARGPRRVILATNVAETSLTVPGIRGVVDTGLAKINRYDAPSRTLRLQVEAISQSSADQRAGRCGRIASGVCIRLFAEHSYKNRAVFTDPEIKRTSLAGVILQMRTLGLGAIEDFAFLDKPDTKAIADGYETLFELGALSAPSREGTLTPIGESLARVPLEPRVARVLLGGIEHGVLEDVLVLASVLSIQDPRERPTSKADLAQQAQSIFEDPSSDFITLLNLWHASEDKSRDDASPSWSAWCREHFLSNSRMREWRDMVRQLRQIADDLPRGIVHAGDTPRSHGVRVEGVHRALLSGLISNVACRESDAITPAAHGSASGSKAPPRADYRTIRGLKAQVFPGSVLFKARPKWIMAAEVVQTSRLFARTIASIEPEWIEAGAAHLFKRQYSDAHFDASSGQPRCFERVVLGSIVVVPRRSSPLAPFDPVAARRVFIREGLAQARWQLDAPFMLHNRSVLARAALAQACLRTTSVLVHEDTIASFFEQRVPAHIADPAAFEGWLVSGRTNWGASPDESLRVSLEDVLVPEAQRALDKALFPSTVVVGACECPIEYVCAPGRPDDGVTCSVPVLSLPAMTPTWTLVPGLVPDIVASLIKQLPKAQRHALDHAVRDNDPVQLASHLAQAMLATHAGMSLQCALSEACLAELGVPLPEHTWALKTLPEHMRVRVRVVEDGDTPEALRTAPQIASDHDLDLLRERMHARLAKAQCKARTKSVARSGIVAWDFGDWESLPPNAALVDEGDASALTLAPTPELALAWSRMGIRRLFACAVSDEVRYYFEATPAYAEASKHFAGLGTPQSLFDQLTLVLVERVFMEGQPPLRDQASFELRLETLRSKLPVVARDIGTLAASVLEPRFLVAKRLAGGTNRLWADSIADIREHAAYLMPVGFLSLIPSHRLRELPRYALLMRERLLNLREEGSKVETQALATFAPHWKRFTAHVARAMSHERRAADEAGDVADASAGDSVGGRTGSGPRKTPLPQARRAAPSVNVDAGAWAMRPGNLAPAVEQYRWALEELRVSLFSPTPPKKPTTTSEIEKLAKAAGL